MSSFNKLIKRKIHKERGQPSKRAKYGLLEKKKDYKLRAMDYHRKQDTLRVLKEKASMKNPDEYYHKMNNVTLKNGVHVIKRQERIYKKKEKQQMKKQDIDYLLMKSQAEKKILQLKDTLHYITKSKNDTISKHVYIANDQDDDDINNIVEKHNHIQLYQQDEIKKDNELYHSGQMKYKELKKRQQRLNEIEQTRQKLYQQKQLLTKGRRKKIVIENRFGEIDHNQSYFIWKKDRKK